jgi:hypothetical protein
MKKPGNLKGFTGSTRRLTPTFASASAYEGLSVFLARIGGRYDSRHAIHSRDAEEFGVRHRHLDAGSELVDSAR